MDDREIRQMADRLEAAADQPIAKSQISRFDDGSFVVLTANRSGLVRLAATLLHAATDPIPPHDCRSRLREPDETLDQTTGAALDCRLAGIQRMEEWPEPEDMIHARRDRVRKRDRWALLGCGFVAFGLLFVFSIGLITIFSSLFGR